MKLNIIYEDNHLIAVYKPAGILTQRDKTGDKSLFDHVKKYIKETYQKPGNVYLGLLHRLDRPASGLILFAKTSKATSRLSEQFRDSRVTKKYYALVEGQTEVGETRKLTHYLKKNPDKNIVKVSDNNKTDYKKSILEYTTIKKSNINSSFIINHFYKLADQSYPENSKYSLLKINLITGRSHQIRVQLSHIGHPIAGDIKYGAQAPLPQKNICLVSYQLTFKHPTKNTKIMLKLPGI